MTAHLESTTAKLLVTCLENEGVEYIFGIPGEENIHFIDALRDSPIRYILTRHEQGASFMADIYGRLTGKAGVCSATLGPGRSICCWERQMRPPRALRWWLSAPRWAYVACTKSRTRSLTWSRCSGP